MDYLSYFIIFFLSLAVLAVVSLYCFKHRGKLTQMECMMICMVLGMFSGLITATLYLIPTGDFLSGFIVGTLVGMGFGVFLGRLGDHLALLEGLVAGPMGGMMGAMLGQMIRPFSIEIFIPFLMFIFLVTMAALAYMVFDKTKKLTDDIAARFFLSWTVPVIVLVMAVAFDLPFSIKASAAAGPSAIAQSQAAKAADPKDNGQTKKSAGKGNVQEVELVAEEAAYSPSTIHAKENVPLVIKARADNAAGCVSEIVFRDLGISKIIPIGGSTTIEMGSLKKGVYGFSCPMGMAPGKLVVE